MHHEHHQNHASVFWISQCTLLTLTGVRMDPVKTREGSIEHSWHLVSWEKILKALYVQEKLTAIML